MNTARWFMERFGVSETVIGDLLEESHRRSLGWIWKQTAVAVANAVWGDVRARPAVIVRSVLLGFVLIWLADAAMQRLWTFVNVPWMSILVAAGLRHQINPLTGLVRTAIGVPFAIAVGWGVARSHSLQTPVPELAFLVVWVCLALPGYGHLVLNAIESSRFVPYAIVNGIGFLVAGASIVGGVLWARRNHAIR